jgi:undecaprenyl-diphosphatase
MKSSPPGGRRRWKPVNLQLPAPQSGRVNLDESMLQMLNQAGSNLGLDLLMVALTIIGMTYVLVFSGPLLWWRKHRELGFDLVVLIIISDLVVEGLKLIFMRERPPAVLGSEVHTLSWGFITTATSYSFPSGHASRAFAMAILISLGTRYRVGASVMVLAFLISVSRIYLGLHWPSDVLAGALLGAAMALVMHWVAKKDNAYTRARNRAISWLRGLKHSGQQSQSS